jgi:hypothetical protein
MPDLEYDQRANRLGENEEDEPGPEKAHQLRGQSADAREQELKNAPMARTQVMKIEKSTRVAPLPTTRARPNR